MKLRMVLEAVDRASGPVRRLRGLIQTTGRDQQKLTAYTERLGRVATRTGIAIGTMAGSLAGMAGVGVVSMLRTAAEFEQFQVVLEGTEGSATKARTAMNWISRFAATTPYEIAQVTEAFTKLRAYGIDPTDGTLRTLGDTAAGTSKQINDAVEMMADAQMGEFERLKEFGIRASKEGDRISFRWVKNGQDMVTASENSSSAIRRSLMSIFDQRFGGMMEKQSKTLIGLLSNLKDRFTLFALEIANNGAFDAVKARVEQFGGWLDQLENSGKGKEIAMRISDKLVKFLDWLAEIDWLAVGAQLLSLAQAIGRIVGFIADLGGGGLEGFFNMVVYAMIIKFTFALGGLAAAFGVVSIAGAPLFAIVAVIALLAGAAFLLWRNWDKVAAWWSGLWQRIVEISRNARVGVISAVVGMWNRAKGAFRAGVNAIWNALPGWMRKVLTGASFLIRFSPVGAALGAIGKMMNGGQSAPAGNARAAAAGVGRAATARARVAIDLRAPAGMTAHLRGRQSGDVTVSTRRTGRSMPGVGE